MQDTSQAPNAPAATATQPAQSNSIAQQAQMARQEQSGPVSAPQMPFHVTLPHSYNPFAPYRASDVPAANLTNSPRLGSLMRDGKLYLSLKDAIALALENNLDIAFYRYNLPIADTDILRTKAGGQANGVATNVSSNTEGGASGTSSSNAGVSATGSGGGAGGAGGLVTSTLGAGSAINSFDPVVSVQGFVDHTTATETNSVLYGIPTVKYNTIEFLYGYSQAYPTGTSFSLNYEGQRQTSNIPENILNPQIYSAFELSVNQPLLQGFGLATNERYIHIAKKNRQLTDLGFRAQVIATVTQVENIYWDLVSAYQDEQIKEHSLAYANETLSDDQKQLDLKAIPAMQVMKDQSAVATSEGDLTVAKATLHLNEMLIKDALTKTLDDPALAEMPVIPLDLQGSDDPNSDAPIDALIEQAEKNRPDVSMDDLAMQIAQNNLKTVKNELLPSLSLYGNFYGSGYGGQLNPACLEAGYSAEYCSTTLPGGIGGALQDTFNYSSPEYTVGFKLNLTLRNRVAKADQFRAVLEYRQKELTFEAQKKQIRFDVRNSQYALQQAKARVLAAEKARDLAQKTFDVAKQEQQLGAMSSYDTLTSEQALALAESTLAVAQGAYEKTKVDIDRATGSTLDRMDVSIDDAKSGVVTH
ncbi:hypothetical protein GCM10011586_33470 [Silvibacterium dinghuense]|nr:hypothetical protein GCM10011586_33470 [Silvibacterium dinghuense]